jgi:hypothetical protein
MHHEQIYPKYANTLNLQTDIPYFHWLKQEVRHQQRSREGSTRLPVVSQLEWRMMTSPHVLAAAWLQ